jgi:predicted dehydrogenase
MQMPQRIITPGTVARTRRTFLKQAGLGLAAATLPRFSILSAPRGERVRCAIIGCGTRGLVHLDAIAAEQLVAIVDVDTRQHAAFKSHLQQRSRLGDHTRTFTDYRRLFDKQAKNLDAVFIATPNHQHALPARLAMQAGLAVYVEKPLSYDIGEARALRILAQTSRVATQLGHQGHCEEGYRRLCEYIWSGAIGPVTETHSWTNRANGGVGPRPARTRVPVGLHWDEWIGPAPYRDHHPDLHPHEWHGWHDFGNGSIGNMGCHILDGVFWALRIEHPTRIEMEQVRGGSDERWPLGCRIRYDVPARGELPPLKVFWYEGLNPTAPGDPEGKLRVAKDANRYLPPRLWELSREFPDEELASMDNGTLYVGEKGVIVTGTYGDKMHIVPWEKMRATSPPAKSLPRPKAIFTDFLEAIRAGRTETAAGFDYGARLTEFTLLANLAMHAGVNRTVEWDGPNGRVTNRPELNDRVARTPRPGWRG